MIVKFILGYGYVESFEDFVDCCYALGHSRRMHMDQVVMDILGGYYPSLHKALTDTHAGVEDYPGKFGKYGSRASMTSLDKYVFPYLQEMWNG